MNYYLGIDGGGTKTHAVVIDEKFNIVYECHFPGTYIIIAGDEEFTNIMNTIYTQAQEFTNNSIKHIFCALAGYGEFKNDNDKIERILKSTFKETPFKVLNDSVGVWAGGLLCQDGIGLIAGTGSNCCGIKNQEYVRVGGWGYLAGDEASAYWIALKTVNAYMRMFDGRMEETILKHEMDEKFNLSKDHNVLNLIYREMDCQRPEIAQIAKITSKAAQKGCPISTSILHEAAQEIYEHIKTTAKRMNVDTSLPVTYTGGVFNSVVFKEKLIQLLGSEFTLHEPITNAATGSAIYAYVLAGNEITDEKINNIKSSIA